ncbi:hypothetical protein PAJ34TS1_28330 [Paenibacillus azoreducens]|uniref:Uncharacterized protein n=1 Tax=Paenibacillus azoreducens TaxID=116718 RepID=A0A919Y7K7_9BACL|nr:hypothetical protein J34TS1_11810 [Paenibacillus azoreducens]
MNLAHEGSKLYIGYDTMYIPLVLVFLAIIGAKSSDEAYKFYNHKNEVNSWISE